MRAYHLNTNAGPDTLELVNLPAPTPQPGEVVMRVKACSLNDRDLLLSGTGNTFNANPMIIPLSDGAGEIIAVGEGVRQFQIGDRVAANSMRDWISGPATESVLHSRLGHDLNGMLAEQVCLSASSVVALPEHLSFSDGAALPSAALAAWNAVSSSGIKAGDVVLILGTGDVSLFALQFAKAAGARTIVTTRSDDKATKARSLGADHTINTRTTPAWHEEVLAFTSGRGADLVVQAGATNALARSRRVIRQGGTMALVELFDDADGSSGIESVPEHHQVVQVALGGSVSMFQGMNQALAAGLIYPTICRIFPFEQARAAYWHLASQKHFGKVVIELRR